MSGNPLPHLEWFAGNKKVEGAKIEKAESGTFVSSEISIKVDRSDNGKTYHCRAQNKATQEPFTKSVQLKVNFPPTKVEIEVEPENPVAGSVASLKCKADSANPQVKIVWYRNNEFLSGSGSDDTVTVSGQFGGVVTSSIIQTDVSDADINSVYKCEARHAETSNTISNTSKIGVQCEYAILYNLLHSFKN